MNAQRSIPDPILAARLAALPEHPSLEAKVRALVRLGQILARRELRESLAAAMDVPVGELALAAEG